MLDFFRYDFDYAWPWMYGHLIAAVAFATLAWVAHWLRWTRLMIVAGVLAVWGLRRDHHPRSASIQPAGGVANRAVPANRFWSRSGCGCWLRAFDANGVVVETRCHGRRMREMPFADASFDGVVSVAAIDHLNKEGVERTLAEVARVLRPDGQFLLMVVNPDIWTKVALPFLHGHGYFGAPSIPDRWRSHLAAAGLTAVDRARSPRRCTF